MKKGIIVLWLFFVAFFFCSCAKKQEATSPAGPQEGSWKEKGFVAPEEALFKAIDRRDLRKMFDEAGIEYQTDDVTEEEEEEN